MTEAVSAAMTATIGAALKQIETEECATILLAVESGSRAWGFHSSDSDYDVRFIYARPVDWHLSVAPGRDVIERPIDAELDLSGWDLRKTLGLILKSNAVVLEWLHSPIRYRDDTGLRSELLDFCERALRPKSLAWHYLRLGSRQRNGIRTPDGTVKLKRYFYTLRPALALRWLRMHKRGLLPMDIGPLMDQTDLPPSIRQWVEELIAVKRETGEMGVADVTNADVDSLLTQEFGAAKEFVASTTEEPRPDLWADADVFHQKWVHHVTDNNACASDQRSVTISVADTSRDSPAD